MHVTMTQHPVGQGGLFSGTLSLEPLALRWAYDCGSNQRTPLTREIGEVAAAGPLDLLFLSHLDSDHINGVDQLLAQTTPREVVLPYINEAILLATIARDASRGTLTGTFIEAASNLSAWFGSRGVETVTIVDGFDDDDGTDGPILPGGPEGEGGGEIRAKWTGTILGFQVFDAGAAAARSGAVMYKVDPGSSLLVATSRGTLNWVLIPYVHKPSKRLMNAFEAELRVKFGPHHDKREILDEVKKPNALTKLRDCYDALWLDHNLISMTLYSGPWKSLSAPTILRRGPRRRYWLPEAYGWMLTGDAHLDRKGRRQKFIEFYQQFTRMIGVLMMPHHGSIQNHSDLLLSAMSELRIGYAAVGPNNYGHPHPYVRNAVNAGSYDGFHRVDTRRSSLLQMEISSP